MSYLVKGLAGAAGCSGVCGGGYLLSQSLKVHEDHRVTAKSLIVDSGRTLLTSDSNQWTERWSEYVTATGNPLGISDYEKVSQDKQKAPESFKHACLTKVEEKVSGEDDSLFKSLSTYCIEMTAISQLITNGNTREVLSDSNDEVGWKAAWANYINNSEGNKWGLTNWDNDKKNPQSVPQDLKTKCGTKKGEKAYGVRDIKFRNVIDWCTKAKG
ncbi:hypothetical protein HF1_12480 [Mycoplasma haemofelis str. Langford 1]|uniref:Uncharacterized protein n=1 Tax=Mycoplasma haemofelis (strain Langford 1) TaxID=941640 RepID=E8ZJD5_MYCHL|nr:hypothetical protein [Mycoplasma haemofelis]CBY93256.1 hypothetical protein HF1_12480 [Mycoplasma haemofelis str. Langford 1]